MALVRVFGRFGKSSRNFVPAILELTLTSSRNNAKMTNRPPDELSRKNEFLLNRAESVRWNYKLPNEVIKLNMNHRDSPNKKTKDFESLTMQDTSVKLCRGKFGTRVYRRLDRGQRGISIASLKKCFCLTWESTHSTKFIRPVCREKWLNSV